MLTIKTVLQQVRALGLTCRFDSDYQEFVINYKRSDPRWTPDSSYHTPYRDDAIASAKVIAALDGTLGSINAAIDAIEKDSQTIN